MRRIRTIGLLLVTAMLTGACATTVRNPLPDVPAGEYVLVEPEMDAFWAVAINDRAFTTRMDDQIHTGEHWVDAAGMLHMADLEGPCVGVESIWDYDYAAGQIELNLIEDRCEMRPMALPDRMVWETR